MFHYLSYDMTLAERYIDVKANRRVTPHELLGHMANCFRTMLIIHSAGLVHANLDLVALYLDTTGKRVLIGDFSLARVAKQLNSESIRSLLRDNRRPSPEFINVHAKLHAFKQDVWSLGLCFVYLWTSSIEQIDYSKPRFIKKILDRENSPQLLTDILTRACAYDPSIRPSMQELHEMTVTALDRLEAQLDEAALLVTAEADLDSPEVTRAIEFLVRHTKRLSVQITHTLCNSCQKVVKKTALVTLVRCGHHVCQLCSITGLTQVVQGSEGLEFKIVCKYGENTSRNCGQHTPSNEIPPQQLCCEIWEAALRKVTQSCPVCREYIERPALGMRGYFNCKCGIKLCANCVKPWTSSRHGC
jgi:serine/threonine protein kinase